MPKGYYRKKPIVVEAVQWKGDNWLEVDQFMGDYPHETYPKAGIVKIHTLEGVMIANLGDYIIKGIKGEFYPCKPDIFAETYEPVND